MAFKHGFHSQFKWSAFLAWNLVFLLAVGVNQLFAAASAQTLTGWKLVWADEFNQADGSSPDPENWGFDIGGQGWGNNEWEYYTDRTKNARIEGGHLIIEAHKEHFENRDYTSARLLTQGKREWTYGRVEARIQVPRGQGIWPAFWMLGSNIDSVGWPGCGEIDIMEHIGREPLTVYGTIHGPGYSGGAGIGDSLEERTDFADDFHIFAIEWEKDAIRWYVDGFNYFTVTPDDLDGHTWVFDHPHFILLNVAVGGNWPGYPDETTVFPQQMRVDYVRVYERSSGPVPVVPHAWFDGENIVISFQTENGVTYQVASKTDISDPVWTPIESILGDGTVKTVSYRASSLTRYFVIQTFQ